MLKNIDWLKLSIHLLTSLLIVMGTTGTNHGDMIEAMRLWFFGSLIYTGGYLQVGEKKPDDLP